MSKITRRTYKRKKILMGAALFGAVGLVSTGFAAWVLSASASNTQRSDHTKDEQAATTFAQRLGFYNATVTPIGQQYTGN